MVCWADLDEKFFQIEISEMKWYNLYRNPPLCLSNEASLEFILLSCCKGSVYNAALAHSWHMSRTSQRTSLCPLIPTLSNSATVKCLKTLIGSVYRKLLLGSDPQNEAEIHQGEGIMMNGSVCGYVTSMTAAGSSPSSKICSLARPFLSLSLMWRALLAAFNLS